MGSAGAEDGVMAGGIGQRPREGRCRPRVYSTSRFASAEGDSLNRKKASPLKKI